MANTAAITKRLNLTFSPCKARDSQHLIPLYNQLNWTGSPLDHLVIHLKQDTATLTAQLMELELLGLCMQQSGVYLRCRPNQ